MTTNYVFLGQIKYAFNEENRMFAVGLKLENTTDQINFKETNKLLVHDVLFVKVVEKK